MISKKHGTMSGMIDESLELILVVSYRHFFEWGWFHKWVPARGYQTFLSKRLGRVVWLVHKDDLDGPRVERFDRRLLIIA